MKRERSSTNIKARIVFLNLAAEADPAVYNGPEMLDAVQAFREYLSKFEPSLTGLRYVRITLHKAHRSDKLRAALDAWATKFNLKDRWCFDHLLGTLARLARTAEEAELKLAWWRALIERNEESLAAIYGPPFEFYYSWPDALTGDDVKPFEVDEHYQNPLDVLEENFLLDVKEKFAVHVKRALAGSGHDDDYRRWEYLEQIVREVRAFDRKLNASAARAKKDAEEYLKKVRELHKLDPENYRWMPFLVKGPEVSRNLHLLVMFQVQKMSYGEIAKAANQKEKTVTEGIKAAARLIGLTLRAPNKPGRKKGSRTEKSTGHIVR